MLPFTPPPLRTKRFRREQFCGLTVDGLPPVSGLPDPTAPFMPHLDRYAVSDQDRILRQNAERGYEWLTLSWPDSRAFGLSRQQYVDNAQRFKAFHPFFLDHHFFSKYYDRSNPDPYSVRDVINALLDAEAIDAATIAWEMDLEALGGGNLVSPDHVDTMVDGFDDMLPDTVLRYLHQSQHYVSWQKNTNDSPHAYWQRKAGKITGQKYQMGPPGQTSDEHGNPTAYWSAGMCCARVTDGLDRLVAGGIWQLSTTFDLVLWEGTATTRTQKGTDEFGTRITEDQQDLRGYETLCSPGRMFPAGFGNGARLPDGKPV